MRWIVLMCVALLSACQPTAEPTNPKAPTSAANPTVPSDQEQQSPIPTPPAPAHVAPQVPEFYANSPYKDTIAVANVNVGKPYALFKQFLTQDGWSTTEHAKCVASVNHPNAQVLCQTVPEILNCPSPTQCNVLWVKKGGASVVVELMGNMVDINNTASNSSLVIKKFTFFGISEKNQEVPDPAARFEEQMKAPPPSQAPSQAPSASPQPVAPQSPISPTT